MGKKAVKENEYVRAKRSSVHNLGLFAKIDIPKGTKIVAYIGEKITKKQSEERTNNGNPYVFEFNSRYDIDGSVLWNLARYANHSCEPNAETVDHKKDIWLRAIRDIKKNEEIVYDYCYSIEDYQDNPCRCGSSKCVGYMVDQAHWKKLKKLLNKN